MCMASSKSLHRRANSLSRHRRNFTLCLTKNPSCTCWRRDVFSANSVISLMQWCFWSLQVASYFFFRYGYFHEQSWKIFRQRTIWARSMTFALYGKLSLSVTRRPLCRPDLLWLQNLLSQLPQHSEIHFCREFLSSILVRCPLFDSQLFWLGSG